MRLIDADIMLQNYEGDVSAYHNAGHSLSNVEGWMRYYLSNAPTIDAVPVVRGEWTTNSDYPDTVICSLCGWRESVWWADKGTNYCPNCGAKMEDKPCG
jgi:hypothetical protein